MAFLLFEGVDKTGKTTLLKAVNKVSSYQHFCIDRCLGSAYVYDLITGRRDRFKKLEKIEKEFSRIKSIPIITVLLTCDPSILVERIKNEDGSPQKRIRLLNEAIEAYKNYEKKTRLPIVKIDTTNKTIEDTVKEILFKIKKYEK